MEDTREAAPTGDEHDSPGYVYFIIPDDHDTTLHVKIGVSVDPIKRLCELQTGNAHKLRIYKQVYVSNAYEVEDRLHQAYRSVRVRGEWFRLSLDQVSALVIGMTLLARYPPPVSRATAEDTVMPDSPQDAAVDEGQVTIEQTPSVDDIEPQEIESITVYPPNAEVRPAPNHAATAKQWICDNPPGQREGAQAYYDRYKAANGTALITIQELRGLVTATGRMSKRVTKGVIWC